MAGPLALSCGGENSATQAVPSAHQLSPETRDQIVGNVEEDLQVVAGVQPETLGDLPRALTGKALEDTKKSMEDDLVQGRYRRRDYRNLNVRLYEYFEPVAQVFVEFDDFGYYVDARTGAALEQPAAAHHAYSLAVIEEEGRWKIKSILEPSTPETPRELPATTATSPH